jgi:2-polyprenyl-6-methoxyphenol hydroxylase-like FAD-dependent oxidoreductase
MSPFVGDGVNCTMSDSLVLSRILEESGVTQQAIAIYEEDMFPFASDVIIRSVLAVAPRIQWDSPRGYLKMMAFDSLSVKMALDY